MRVLSFDIGIRTLAFARLIIAFDKDAIVVDGDVFRGTRIEIEQWRVIDVATEFGTPDINLNKTRIQDLVDMIMTVINRNACILFENSDGVLALPDVIFLESQPVGIAARNIKMKVISHVIQVLLRHMVYARLENGQKMPPLFFVSPKLKLQDVDNGGGVYRSRKAYAVECTHRLLPSCVGAEPWIEMFLERTGKKDDLADAFLQGVYAGRDFAIKQARAETRKERADAKRRRTSRVGKDDEKQMG